MMNESQKQGMESVRAPRRAVRLKAETLRALEIQDPGVPKAFTDLCTDLCTVHCPTMSYCACTTTC